MPCSWISRRAASRCWPTPRGSVTSPSWSATATSWSTPQLLGGIGVHALPDPTLLRAWSASACCCPTATRCAWTTSRTSSSAPGRATRPGRQDFLARPLAERVSSARACATRARPAAAGAARRWLGRHRPRPPPWPGCRQRGATPLVHGHTHRPGALHAGPRLRPARAERLGPRRPGPPRAEVLRLSRDGFARLAPQPADRAPDARAGGSGCASAASSAPSQRRAIPDALWALTLARFPFLALRSAADLQPSCARLSSLFLDSKEFSRRPRPGGHRRHGRRHRRAGLPAGARAWA